MDKRLRYQHLHLSDFDISKIPFPSKGDFAESCCFGENGKMYIPINNRRRCTIYELDVSSGTFKSLTTLRSVILGSCIRGNNLILADTLNRCVILFDVSSEPTQHPPRRFPIAGFPNDVCYADDNTVYVVSNVNYRSKNGIVHRIDLSTDPNSDIDHTTVVMANIYSGCGIQFVDSVLYVATLMNVICYDTQTNTRTEILSNHVDRSLYDNVTVISEDELCITIFDNNSATAHRAMRNPCLRTLLIAAMSATIGVAYFDINNIDRRMNNRRISYVKYNKRTKESTYVTFDKRIEAFDNTVTCMCYHNDSCYVINWKANCLVRLTPKSDQRTVYDVDCV